MKRIFSVVLAALCVAALFSGCGNVSYAQADQIIIPADTLANYIGQENTVIVDMQAEENYLKSHIPGAVNIQLKDITVNLPVENMLAPKGKIAKVLGGQASTTTPPLSFMMREKASIPLGCGGVCWFTATTTSRWSAVACPPSKPKGWN
jgi:hypothetical protein